jgi:hypothetical protein
VGPGCDPQTLNSDLALVLMRDLKGRSDGECDLHEDMSFSPPHLECSISASYFGLFEVTLAFVCTAGCVFEITIPAVKHWNVCSKKRNAFIKRIIVQY